MSFWWWIVIILAVGIAAGVLQAIGISKKSKNMEGEIGRLPDFTATQKIMGSDGEAGLALDESRGKLCLITNKLGQIDTRIVEYRDILQGEIFEDGETVTKTSRGSQLGGALVGGLALGGVGAIIGGLSGSKKSQQKVSRVDLRVTVNDPARPLHTVRLLSHESKKTGILYTSAIESARHWHGVIAVLIKRADSEDSSIGAATKPALSSVSAELEKLFELRAKGALTDAEYENQKLKLLS